MTTNQTQDTRTAPAATGREGDAPSAPTTKKAPTTGPSKRDVERKAVQDRNDRIKPVTESEATAHRAVREAVQVTENAGARWRIAADAVKAHYKTLPRAEKARDIIVGWMIEGLPQADQVALAIDKKALNTATDEQKAARKTAGSKLSVYFARMMEYAFPKAVATAKAKAKTEAPTEKPLAERIVTIINGAIGAIEKEEGPAPTLLECLKHLKAALLEAKKA